MTTLDCYRRHCESYLIPRLGAGPLQGLTSDRLTLLYRDLLEQGGVKGRPLSPNSVRRIHATLHRALRDAQSWGYPTRNVASSATKPRVPRLGERLQTCSGDEVAAFLAAVRHDRLYAAWHLAISTGMRRSELLGLRWQDVDLALARASVRQVLTHIGHQVVIGEPKTRRSRRAVALDRDTVAVRHLQLRLEKHPRLAGLLGIRFHDLRHTPASLALQAGVSARVVSDRLGHASVAFTLDVYSHVVPSLQEEAAERVAELFRRA